MQKEIKLNRYSIGIGDRFGYQAEAQLKALINAKEQGVELTPVWNKSFREHQIIESDPSETRLRADEAVKKLGWNDAYFVDADHINLTNVDFFIESCDFFTIDVAQFIGRAADRDAIERFVSSNKKFCGSMSLPELDRSLEITEANIRRIAEKYLFAAQKAAEIYRRILNQKKDRTFLIEISMDEILYPQTPAELFFILAALAEEKVPLNTIAPKFSGRFNKGVDYVGDLSKFEGEFEQDIAVLKLAVQTFAFDENLKLSIHSGSDKFSLYPIIKKIVEKHEVGLHLKTAGTTWLEELIGLAEAGGPGLAIAKEVYRKSLEKYDKLCVPYASVIEIDFEQLPSADAVDQWSGSQYASTLRHDQSNTNYNPHFRQLLHIGYKIAAEMGFVYLSALRDNKRIIGRQVTENIYERHIRPLFSG